MTEFAPVAYILGCATTVARDPEVYLRFDIPFLRPSLRDRLRRRGLVRLIRSKIWAESTLDYLACHRLEDPCPVQLSFQLPLK